VSTTCRDVDDIITNCHDNVNSPTSQNDLMTYDKFVNDEFKKCFG